MTITNNNNKLGFLRRAKIKAEALAAGDVFIYEPVPMPLMRLKDRERGQLLVESGSRARLHAFLVAWSAAMSAADPRDAGTDWTIEVDPADI